MVLSHGEWTRGPDRDMPGGARVQTFADADGRCWYEHTHAALADPATRVVLVRDGVVAMLERDGTRLVPPGLVLEVADGVEVERGWLWRDGGFLPPPPPGGGDALTRLSAFLADNPDVAALIR